MTIKRDEGCVGHEMMIARGYSGIKIIKRKTVNPEDFIPLNDRYNRTTVFQNWNDDNPPSLINSSSYKQNNVTKLPVKTSITGVF